MYRRRKSRRLRQSCSGLLTHDNEQQHSDEALLDERCSSAVRGAQALLYANGARAVRLHHDAAAAAVMLLLRFSAVSVVASCGAATVCDGQFGSSSGGGVVESAAPSGGAVEALRGGPRRRRAAQRRLLRPANGVESLWRATAAAATYLERFLISMSSVE